MTGVVDDLRSRGLVNDSGGEVRSAPEGERLPADLAPQVDEVRRRVAALPEDEYKTLLRLLEQLVTALGDSRGEVQPG